MCLNNRTLVTIQNTSILKLRIVPCIKHLKIRVGCSYRGINIGFVRVVSITKIQRLLLCIKKLDHPPWNITKSGTCNVDCIQDYVTSFFTDSILHHQIFNSQISETSFILEMHQ